MDIQLIITLLIGAVVLFILFRGIYRFFFVKRESGHCGGCSGCELKKRDK